MNLLTVNITDAPRPDLVGMVTFKHPNIYAHLAIGRRTAELINTGARPGAPLLTLADVPYAQQQTALMVSTLEHVINSAPSGFYLSDERGHPHLDLGQFDEFDTEPGEDSFLWMLYAAYAEWRQSFRRERTRAPG